MTVVLPGMSETKEATTGPVTFAVAPGRLVTVRHHNPRPFETYPDRAARVGPGCTDPDRIFLSLMEEIVGRLADLLEGAGRALDGIAAQVYAEGTTARAESMQETLRGVGRQGEQISRVRLALLTIERAVSYYGQLVSERPQAAGLRPVVKGLMRDVQALEVHADFLASRVALATDATLGMINLAQAQTIKIFSVLAVVFLPPTVIASAYGMNFEYMPELGWTWGYPMALGLMLASAVGTYLYFKWKRWL
jgi:magnesium transporter